MLLRLQVWATWGLLTCDSFKTFSESVFQLSPDTESRNWFDFVIFFYLKLWSGNLLFNFVIAPEWLKIWYWHYSKRIIATLLFSFKFMINLPINSSQSFLNGYLLDHQVWSFLKSFNICFLAIVAKDSLTTFLDISRSFGKIFSWSALKVNPLFRLFYWVLILLKVRNVIALSSALNAKLVLTSEAARDAKLCHFLGFVEVNFLNLLRHALE